MHTQIEKGKIESQKDFLNWSNSERPDFIPSDPRRVYIKKGWKGFTDFCGYEPKKNKRFLSFEKAREYMHTKVEKGKIKSFDDFSIWLERPTFIPSKPQVKYKGKGWKGFPDFCGYKNPKFSSHNRNFLSFEEAREYMHTKVEKGKIKRWVDFVKWSKIERPDFIPAEPHVKYKNEGWINYADFCGYKKYKRIKKRRIYFWEKLI